MTFSKFLSDFSDIVKHGFVDHYFNATGGAVTTNTIIVKIAAIALCCIVGYFLGSINFAIIISKSKNDDIRSHGSNNAGATNMLRTYGKKAAILTFAGDFLKAIVSCFIGGLLWANNGIYLAGLFCVIGHIFPVFYKFKGGKGVATVAGVMLFGNPGVFLILLVLFIGVFATSKYVSLASVMCAMLYPFVLQRMELLLGGVPDIHIVFTLAMSVIVIIKHIPNINRILNHTESKTYFSKKKRAEEKARREAIKAQLESKNKKSRRSSCRLFYPLSAIFKKEFGRNE